MRDNGTNGLQQFPMPRLGFSVCFFFDCKQLPSVPTELILESVSTGVWCVPGFGAGFEIALEPSKLQKEGDNPGKGHFYFLRQTLVCTNPWFERDLIDSFQFY